MNLEGRLKIDIRLAKGKTNEVSIQSTRPVTASRIFHGKTADEVLKILPMLYNVCGNAQAQAAQLALMKAQGDSLPDAHPLMLAREMLLWMETAREHLYRILLDWPRFIAEPEQADVLKQVLSVFDAFKKALFVDGLAFGSDSKLQCDFEQLNILVDELNNIIQNSIFNGDANQWFNLNSLEEFNTWLGNNDNVASRLLTLLYQADVERPFASSIGYLPELEESALLDAFAAENADKFIAEPLWRNMSYETTPLARQSQHPLIKELFKDYGSSALTRFVARLLELAEIPTRLKTKLQLLKNSNDAEVRTNSVSSSGVGIAQVEAARGRLIHCVELENDRVKRYQILAPTEWNFHPQGVVAQGLTNLTASDETELRKQADMLINAVDPCVAYDITVH